MAYKSKPARLWQELVLTLALKILLLATIWAAFFSAPQDRSMDGQQAAAHILSLHPLKEQNHDADPGTR